MSVLSLEVASDTPLDVRRFQVRESISQPFIVTVVARTPDPSLDLDGIVGQVASFRVVSGIAGALDGDRSWSGICRFAELEQAEPTGLSTYRFEIVPALWLLSQRRDYRIFQHQSAPEIAALVLQGWSLSAAQATNIGAHPKLPYKVQYGETDYAFFCRILEEAGIAFTFPDGETGSGAVTLSDRLHVGEARSGAIPFVENPNEAAEREFLADVRLRDESRRGAYTVRDYDFRRPSYRLMGEAEKLPLPEGRLERYDYRPGGFLVEKADQEGTPAADDQGAARHDAAEGQSLAARSLARERTGKQVLAYRTNVLDLWPGRVFSMSGHPHPDVPETRRLLAIELSLEGAPGEAWTTLGRAVFADVPYRPEEPAARPRARLQSATVVGPAGREIHTDEFGRVRVQFPWDRRGKDDERAGCWIRVSQEWAGAGYGMIALPRIGQEVLVDFLEGDPEQPVIVGRVFNQTHPVIDRLPEHDRRSAWKSDSSPGSGGLNEIFFDDTKGRELFFKQAEKDLRRLAKHDDTSTIVSDRAKSVGANELETTGQNRVQETKRDRVELTRNDQTAATVGTHRERVDGTAIERIEGDDIRLVGQDHHLITGRVRRELVLKDSHLRIGGSRPERVGGTDSLTVTKGLDESVGSYTVTAAGPEGWIHLIAGAKIAGSKIVIESATEVTLKGAAGFIKIDGGGVTIVAPDVAINEGGSPGWLPGPGPKLPETPLMALVEEPPPPEQPLVPPQRPLPPVKPQPPPTKQPWSLDSLEYVEVIAPGAESPKPKIRWHITDPGRQIESGKLDFFRDGNKQEPIHTIYLWTSQLKDGSHELAWDGKITPNAEFPDGYVSVEFPPYTIRLTATEGSTVSSKETQFDVRAVELTLELGTKEMLSEARDIELFEKTFGKSGVLPTGSELVKLYLRSNFFTNNHHDKEGWSSEDDIDDPTSFEQYRLLWGDGPRVPVLARVLFEDSRHRSVLAPLAWGRRGVLWDWEDPPEDLSKLAPEPRRFLEVALDFDKQMTNPHGDNAHVERGGKRSKDGQPPVFVASRTSQFSITKPAKRTWGTFSAPQKTGAFVGKTGILFQPSRQAGDTYRVVARFDAKTNLDVTTTPDAKFKATTGLFQIWRDVDVVQFYVKKKDIPMDFDFADVQKYYDAGYLRLRLDPAIAGGPGGVKREPIDGKLYDQRVRAAFLNYDEPIWDAKEPSVDENTGAKNPGWGPGPLVCDHAFDSERDQFDDTFAVWIRSYQEFKESLIATENAKPGATPGSARQRVEQELREKAEIRNAVDYAEKSDGWALDIAKAACKDFLSAKPGLTLFQFAILHSPAVPNSKDYVLKYTAGVSSRYEYRDRAACFVFTRKKDCPPDPSATLDRTCAHEIGHQLFLPHAPFSVPGHPPPDDADALAHDVADRGCTMGYDTTLPTHFCGCCVLRVRGWDHRKIKNMGPANKR